MTEGQGARAASATAKPLQRRLGRALPLIAVLVFLAAVVGDLETGRRSENASRDVATRLRAGIHGPQPGNRVAVVLIDDADYDTLFAATSPLNARTLQRIIDAVATSRPAAIGVDLDTSDPSFEVLRSPPGIPIIWARGTIVLCLCEKTRGCGVRAPVTPDSLRPRLTYCRGAWLPGESVEAALGYLGGRNDGAGAAATLVQDGDGVIRKYERSRILAGRTIKTFAAAVATTRDSLQPPDQADGERFIQYRPLAQSAQHSAGEVLAYAAANPNYDLFRDRIVLIGGSYLAGRDHYFTPLGQMPGVAIHAQIVETELSGGGAPPASRLLFFGTLTLTSYLVLLLFHFYPLWPAMRRAVLWILVLAFTGSYIVAGESLVYAPYFVLFLGAVVLQQIYAAVKDLHHADVRDAVFEMIGASRFAAATAPDQAGPRAEAALRAAARRGIQRVHARVRRSPRLATVNPPRLESELPSESELRDVAAGTGDSVE